VTTRLAEDPSVYVRSVAAGSLGCLGRRAVATGEGVELIPACLDALVQSLAREENRLAMDRAQQRSIKFTRPTDDSDVCEGGGIDFGLDRFKPVRSAVRENALWSIVILCSHGADLLGTALGPAVDALRQIIADEENVFCVGFAMDALSRLVHLPVDDTSEPIVPEPIMTDLRDQLLTILGDAPVRGWEALVRAGVSPDAIDAFALPA